MTPEDPATASALASAEAEVRALRRRLEDIQSLAQMGDFEWDVETDRISWSEELWRIHALEPDRRWLTYEQALARVHPDDRQQVRERHLQALATGEPYFMTERIVTDDGDIRVLDTSGVVIADPDGGRARMRGVCVDVTGRSRIEDALRHSVARTASMAEESNRVGLRLQDARMRRRQAVEINDNIIQGLAAAVMALEAGRGDAAGRHLHQTLDAARRMVADLLAPLDGVDLDPSDLVRDEAAPATAGGSASSADPVERAGRVGVMLVDDAEDLRLLLRYTLEADGRFVVLAEAADGAEAIERAAEVQPDVILLDVAMPRLDGIGALPRLVEAAPEAVIIVLSGFGADQMEGRAMAAGAAAYLEKNEATPQIVDIVLRHLPDRAAG